MPTQGLLSPWILSIASLLNPRYSKFFNLVEGQGQVRRARGGGLNRRSASRSASAERNLLTFFQGFGEDVSTIRGFFAMGISPCFPDSSAWPSHLTSNTGWLVEVRLWALCLFLLFYQFSMPVVVVCSRSLCYTFSLSSMLSWSPYARY